MNGIAWGTLIVGLLLGWLVLPNILQMFKARSAG